MRTPSRTRTLRGYFILLDTNLIDIQKLSPTAAESVLAESLELQTRTLWHEQELTRLGVFEHRLVAELHLEVFQDLHYADLGLIHRETGTWKHSIPSADVMFLFTRVREITNAVPRSVSERQVGHRVPQVFVRLREPLGVEDERVRVQRGVEMNRLYRNPDHLSFRDAHLRSGERVVLERLSQEMRHCRVLSHVLCIKEIEK